MVTLLYEEVGSFEQISTNQMSYHNICSGYEEGGSGMG